MPPSRASAQSLPSFSVFTNHSNHNGLSIGNIFRKATTLTSIFNQLSHQNTQSGLAISSVSPISTNTHSQIIIQGSGFGNSFPQTIQLGDGSVDTEGNPSIAIWADCFDQICAPPATPPNSWEAGQCCAYRENAIGIYLSSWSDNEIVIDGFGSQLSTGTLSGDVCSGPTTWTICTGDQITIEVWGPSGAVASYRLVVGGTVGTPQPTYSVTFSESGLPSGSSWQVSLGSYLEATGSDSATFVGIPASTTTTYSYSVIPPQNYELTSASPASPLVITGDATVSLSFAPVSGGALSAYANPSQFIINEGLIGCSYSGQTTVVVSNSGTSVISYSLANTNPSVSDSFSPSSSGSLNPGATTNIQITSTVTGVPESSGFQNLCLAPASYFDDNVVVSGNNQIITLPLTIVMQQNNGTGTGGTGYNFAFSAKLVQSSSGSSSYDLIATISPVCASSICLNKQYLLLNQSETQDLITTLYNQLTADGFSGISSSTAVAFVNNTGSPYSVDMQITDALLSCAAAAPDLAGLAKEIGVATTVILLSPDSFIDHGNLASICSGTQVTPLDIVRSVVNNMYNSINTETNDDRKVIGYGCLNSCSSTSEYNATYVVAPGQQLVIQISGLSLPSNGNSLPIELSGSNGLDPWPDAFISNAVLSAYGGALVTCSQGPNGLCYLVNPGSYDLEMTFTSNCWLPGVCSSYSTPTVTVQEPLTIYISTTIAGGEAYKLLFNSSSSELLGTVLATGDASSVNATFLIPQGLDPSGLTNFALFDNGVSVPFTLTSGQDGSYIINTTLPTDSSFALYVPKVIPSLTGSANNEFIIAIGSGFAANSLVTLQYWNGNAWIDLGQEAQTTSSGYFSTSSAEIAPTGTTLFLRAIDSSGNVALTSITVTNSILSTPVFPFGTIVAVGVPLLATVLYAWRKKAKDKEISLAKSILVQRRVYHPNHIDLT